MVLIDVREPEEYKAGHVEVARNIPVDHLEPEKLGDIPKDELIFVYCNSGNRAARAEDKLRSFGFNNVMNCINQEGAEKALQEQGQ